MNNNLKIGIECVPMSMLISVDTNADIFWIHLDDEIEPRVLNHLISRFSFTPNLKLVMTSGYMSEALHDRFDEVLEDQPDQTALVLTVWSEEGFSEALWEFVNVHGSGSNIECAKALIVAESTSVQMKLLAEVAAATLAE